MAIGRILNIGSASGGGKDGMTAMPINDVVIWQKCAGIYGTYKYEVIGDILADMACTKKLLENDNANKYLMRSLDIFKTIVTNEYALTCIGNSRELINTIATNEDLSTAVGALGYENYIKVFKHRSQTSTSGNVASYGTTYATIQFANGDSAKSDKVYKGVDALLMYDNDLSTQFTSPTGDAGAHYWYYTFSTDFILKAVKYCVMTSNSSVSIDTEKHTIKVEAYNEDTSAWIPIYNSENFSSTKGYVLFADCSGNIKPFHQYRLYDSLRNGAIQGVGYYNTCAELTWIGVKPNVT